MRSRAVPSLNCPNVSSPRGYDRIKTRGSRVTLRMMREEIRMHITIPPISGQTMLDLGWLLFLIVLFAYFWRARKSTVQTKLWFKTQGRITYCELVPYEESVWPKIEYVYQVGDQEFTGEIFFLDMAHNNLHSAHARGLAYRLVSAYKAEEAIDVYYNPGNHEQAVLDTTIPWKLNMILGVIAALLLLHVAIVTSRFL